ncbi:MAG: molybdopterin dinucleotide binding domain-containing protein, partial [Acidobacteriota bacterium]
AFDREGGVVLAPSIPLTPLAPIAGAPEPRRPTLFGHDPIEALAEGVLDGSQPLEVLVVVGANPVYSSPAGDRLRQALEKIPMVVAITSFQDETAAEADLILPSHVYLERWQGTTTTPTVAFSVLGVGQPVIEPLFDSRDPGDILLSLAGNIEGLDPEALPWPSYEAYLKNRLEGLVVSGEGTVVTGSFEESWVHFLEERGWRFLEHKSIDSFWKDLLRESSWWNSVRAKGDWQRLLPTPSGRFEFFSQDLEQELQRRGREQTAGEFSDLEALAIGSEAVGLAGDVDEICLPHFEPPAVEGEGELVLVPFQPITARGALSPVSPMVMEMYGYPCDVEWRTWVELAPDTAHHLQLEDGDEVEVKSDRAAFQAVVRMQPGASPGVAHVPTGLGRSEELGGGGGEGANPVAALLAAHDSLTGDRALVSTRVRLRLIRRRAYGGPMPLQGEHG